MNNIVYKRKVDTPGELFARSLCAAVCVKKGKDQPWRTARDLRTHELQSALRLVGGLENLIWYDTYMMRDAWCVKCDVMWYITTTRKKRKQLEDRRNVGENNRNPGDGTVQMAQPWMFMMMMMMMMIICDMWYMWYMIYDVMWCDVMWCI
jgi:hypothetical protein